MWKSVFVSLTLNCWLWGSVHIICLESWIRVDHCLSPSPPDCRHFLHLPNLSVPPTPLSQTTAGYISSLSMYYWLRGSQPPLKLKRWTDGGHQAWVTKDIKATLNEKHSGLVNYSHWRGTKESVRIREGKRPAGGTWNKAFSKMTSERCGGASRSSLATRPAARWLWIGSTNLINISIPSLEAFQSPPHMIMPPLK